MEADASCENLSREIIPGSPAGGNRPQDPQAFFFLLQRALDRLDLASIAVDSLEALLEPQRLDRIQSGSPIGRVPPEEDPDPPGNP
jgi:hypothetical protein